MIRFNATKHRAAVLRCANPKTRGSVLSARPALDPAPVTKEVHALGPPSNTAFPLPAPTTYHQAYGEEAEGTKLGTGDTSSSDSVQSFHHNNG